MAFQFLMQINDVAKKIQHVKEKMAEHSMLFEGNESGGKFKGAGIEGSYVVQNNEVKVFIDKKPFIIPESLIEKKFKDYFA